MNILNYFKRIWQLSLFSFIIAALTGFLYRYGMLYPIPEWMNFANIRHAHSHLMFFNWISPPLMAWMAYSLAGVTQIQFLKSVKWCLYTMLFLGFLSFPFFLLYGYHSVTIGSASLPIAAIISGLVMITWYWFAWLWIQQRKSEPDSLFLLFYDAALLALIISSFGAWGVSIFQFTVIDSPLIASAMTHFFLAVFTEGWAVLAIFGMMWERVEQKNISFKTGWLWIPILTGSMLIFPYSLNQSLITPAMLIAAKTGLILISFSTLLNLWFFIKNGPKPGFGIKTVIGLLILKVMFLIGALLPINIWPGEHGLRVLYLHLLLLGVLSIVIIEWFEPRHYRTTKNFFVLTVLLLIVSLTTISGYWPASLIPPNQYFWIMIIASIPIIPAVLIFLYSYIYQNHLNKPHDN